MNTDTASAMPAARFVTLLTDVDSAAALDHLSDYESRKSVFLGHAARVDDAEDVERFVARVRQDHPEARHVCYAALFRENGGDDPASGAQNERISDDGEPSGTAARPILEAIRFSGVQNCAVAISRRFGGTLLGAGGLVRAYSTAASQALAAAPKGELVRRSRMAVTVGYAQLKTLDHLSSTFGVDVENRDYAQGVRSVLLVDLSRRKPFLDALTQALANTAVVHDLGIALVVRPIPAGTVDESARA